MLDDTNDVSEDTQWAIVLRYELKGAVPERFWGLLNPKSQNAEGLECILEQRSIFSDHDVD